MPTEVRDFAPRGAANVVAARAVLNDADDDAYPARLREEHDPREDAHENDRATRGDIIGEYSAH